MHNNKFNIPFIEFVNNNFNPNEHLFLFWGGYDENIFAIPKIKNIIRHSDLGIHNSFILKIIYRTRQYKLLEWYKTFQIQLLYLFAKKIYLDGLFQYPVIKSLSDNSWCLKKCNWHIWGGDLHYKPLITKDTSKDFESRLHKVISNLAQITGIPDDFKLAQLIFKTKASFTRGYYINPIKKEFLDEILNAPANNKKCVHIVVGNSADPTNNHIRIIDLIAKYKPEDIKVFAPLSYGDINGYAEKVINHGNNTFGNRFIPIIEYMNPKDYSLFLKDIDVAIYNHERQQALHNMHALLYLGKKVYIRSDISTWNHLKDFGVEVYDINIIPNISFQYFTENTHSQKNKKAISPLFNNEYLKKIWKINFASKVHNQ